MEEDELQATNLLFLELGRQYIRRKRTKKRSVWQRKIFEVYELGAHHTLFNELRLGDRENYFRYE